MPHKTAWKNETDNEKSVTGDGIDAADGAGGHLDGS